MSGLIFICYFFVAIDAVRRNPLTCWTTDADVAAVIKEWLKHARDRHGGRSLQDHLGQLKHARDRDEL